MLMHEIQKGSGKKRKALRRGRGGGSGRGNFSTNGMKGQKARAGFSQRPGFEGGQTPLHMRLPKMRGFKQYFKLLKDTFGVNLASLENNKAFKSGDVVTVQALCDAGICSIGETIKILGFGDLTKSLTFKGIEGFSATAKEKITKAGGKIE